MKDSSARNKVKFLLAKLPAVTCLGMMAMLLASCVTPQPVMAPIEAMYAQTGPSEVTTQDIQDSSGKKLYKIYHPKELTSGHPIIVWGNGSHALPPDYDGLLTHLATWGFVVINTYSSSTGTGAELVAAAQYMAEQNNTSSSTFHGRLDPTRLGVAGHSQGSTGAINAHTHFAAGALIKTVVSIALPALHWCEPEDVYETSRISVPFFIMGGTGDGLISPLSSNKLAYDNTPSTLPAAMAMAIDADHNAIQGNGNNHRGYLTAWMSYQLKDDPAARAAFAGDNPEIMTSPGWQNTSTRNLE